MPGALFRIRYAGGRKKGENNTCTTHTNLHDIYIVLTSKGSAENMSIKIIGRICKDPRTTGGKIGLMLKNFHKNKRISGFKENVTHPSKKSSKQNQTESSTTMPRVTITNNPIQAALRREAAKEKKEPPSSNVREIDFVTKEGNYIKDELLEKELEQGMAQRKCSPSELVELCIRETVTSGAIDEMAGETTAHCIARYSDEKVPSSAKNPVGQIDGAAS